MIIYDDLFVHIGLAYPNSHYEEKSNNGFIARGEERVAVGVIAAAVVAAAVVGVIVSAVVVAAIAVVGHSTKEGKR